MFSDEEWEHMLRQELPKGKLIQIYTTKDLPQELVRSKDTAKMLLEASDSFVLFAQPNPLGMVFSVSTLHEGEKGNIAKFALNFGLAGNRLLYELGLSEFHGRHN